MPRAVPTAIASSVAVIIMPNSAGSSRITPIGDRVTAVMPLHVERRTNLTHRSASTCGAGLRAETGALARFFECDEAIGAAAVALAEDEALRRGVT